MKISKEQQSMLAIATGFLVLFYFYKKLLFLVLAGIFCLLVFFPPVNRIIHKGWMFLAEKIGWVSSHIILFILFYLVLSPIAFLRRLIGKNEIVLSDEKKETLFITRKHTYISKDFINPW